MKLPTRAGIGNTEVATERMISEPLRQGCSVRQLVPLMSIGGRGGYICCMDYGGNRHHEVYSGEWPTPHVNRVCAFGLPLRPFFYEDVDIIYTSLKSA